MDRQTEGMTNGLQDLERDLTQALHLLRNQPGPEQGGWDLITCLIGEADLAFREANRRNPNLRLPLLDEAVAQLYEMTGGFTDPEFLRSTGPERRRNRKLFG